MSDTRDGWAGILEPGEVVVWQGRPDPKLSFDGPIGQSAFGVFFFGFACFWTYNATWMSRAAAETGKGPAGLAILFPLFGIPFMAVGFYLLIGRYFWRTYVRRHSWYTLTNRRAIISSNVLGRRKLRSWGVADLAAPELEESGALSSIWFASETRRGQNGSYEVKIGFERIADGRDVLRRISDVRRVQKT